MPCLLPRLFTLAQSNSGGIVKLKAIYFLGVQGLMKSLKKIGASLTGFGNGASLGGKVSRYKNKQNIYKQGAPAYTLFYIQEGGVRLSLPDRSLKLRQLRQFWASMIFLASSALPAIRFGCPRQLH